MTRQWTLTLLLLMASCFGGTTLRADEGMWLLSAPPREQVKKRHGLDTELGIMGLNGAVERVT